MAQIQLTRHLRAHVPNLAGGDFPGETVAEVLAGLGRAHPRILGYLLDDQGSLRPHVNIFVNESLVQDRTRLSDRVGPGDRIFVMQALSGG